MKTIKGFLVIFALLVAQFVSAQDNWFEVEGICIDEEGQELIEISVGPEVSEIVIIPSDPQSNAINWLPGETRTRRFWIDNDSTWIYVAAFYGGGAARFDLGNSQPCQSISAEESVPMNECLGIATSEFIGAIGFEPIENGFVVDGIFYNFHETLSFFVPEDTIWTWDLYVDGRHVLSFEQSAEMPCTVTAIYPQ